MKSSTKTRSRGTRRRTASRPARPRSSPEAEDLPIEASAKAWALAAKRHALELALVPAGARQKCRYIRIENPDGTVTYKYVCELVHTER
jgi:hypothetical protein